MSREALIACCRFGLGPRPGELKEAAADPRGVLKAQIADKNAAVIKSVSSLVSGKEALRALADFTKERRAAKKAKDAVEKKSAEDKKRMERKPNPALAMYVSEVVARTTQQTEASIGFTERLVLFWSNHFSISASKHPSVRIQAGAFEREAIRPHILGRFSDLLKAVEQHPAMLIYLDNHLSVGPTTRFARRGRRGLNENLAREILELHTLGVDSGYTQADVRNLASIITGWTYETGDDDPERTGEFVFAANRHEPGDHTLLGQTFKEAGVKQGEAALEFLATHPSTARHLANKLVKHFIGDDPPPALVARIKTVFRETHGDLHAVSTELISADESWNSPAMKLRSPIEFFLATDRLLNLPDRSRFIVASMAQLGQPIWNPGNPKGYPDTNAHWLSAAGLKARLDFSARVGALASLRAPKDLVVEAFGNAVSRDTRDAVRRSESRSQAIALLLMSPEFQRR